MTSAPRQIGNFRVWHNSDLQYIVASVRFQGKAENICVFFLHRTRQATAFPMASSKTCRSNGLRK